MHTRFFAVTLALLITSVGFAADNLRIDQVSPDSHTYITATLQTVGCGAKLGQVTVTGNRVSITAVPFNFCPLPMGGSVTAKIGMLPAGTYDVAVEGGGVLPSHTTLVVRGVDPAHVIPFGGPTSGGNPVMITTNVPDFGHATMYLPPAVSVTIGDAPAKIVNSGSDFITVTAPPHEAGDVDVSFTVSAEPPTNQQTYTIPAAYRYYDATSATPDPFLFEPLLYPIAFRGVGAYGSEWTTDNVLAIPMGLFATFWKSPCSTCGLFNEWGNMGPVDLDPVSRPDGVVLWIDRGTAFMVHGSCRIRDLSRQLKSAGVEIPLVRELDFRSGLMFLNVPTDSRFRAMVRLWSLDPAGTRAGISANCGATLPLVASAASPDALPFVSADLTPMLQQCAAQGPLTLSAGGGTGSRWWGIISITNNDTQEVTVIAPN